MGLIKDGKSATNIVFNLNLSFPHFRVQPNSWGDGGMGTGAGEQARTNSANGRQSWIQCARQSRERGQSAEEGLFLAEERKNALPLQNTFFKCFILIPHFRWTASERQAPILFGFWMGRNDGRGCAKGIHLLELRFSQNTIHSKLNVQKKTFKKTKMKPNKMFGKSQNFCLVFKKWNLFLNSLKIIFRK